VTGLSSVFHEVIGWPGQGKVRAGVNLAGFQQNWEHDYRIPDVAVFLRDTGAENCDTHWRGPADFLVEITTPYFPA